jgi:hypothetical protein
LLKARLSIALICICPLTFAAQFDGGHIEFNTARSIESSDHSPLAGEIRLKFEGREEGLSWQIHALGEANLDCSEPCVDDALFDRAFIQYSHNNLHITAGRQAISWGNGLIFNPIDIFNPFDPLAIDRKYKPGDDLLHAEYLLENGNNLQFLYVNHGSEYSLSTKLHGFLEELEYDIIAAKHYQQKVVSLGFSLPMGDWLWRTDLQHQQLENQDNAFSLVSNMQRFFELAGKPTSATFEYYHNGLGIDANATQENLQLLLTRIVRGEIFGTGKNYLALALNSQISALWNMGFVHITDLTNKGAISQILSQHSLATDVELIAAVNLPWDNSPAQENVFTPEPTRTLSIQLAWYF